jgi:hypothetical protein
MKALMAAAAGLGDQLMGAGDEDAWRELLYELLHAQLVRRVHESPQERDRDRLDAVGDELLHGGASLLLVERQHDVALPVDPLGDLPDQLRGDDRVGLAVARYVQQLLDRQSGRTPVGAHDQEVIAVAAGRDQPRLRTPALHERVRAHRGSVQQQARLAQELIPLETQLVRRFAERVHKTASELRRRG